MPSARLELDPIGIFVDRWRLDQRDGYHDLLHFAADI
jgi:hypothetical protein